MSSDSRPGSSASVRSGQVAGSRPPVLPFPPLHLGSFHSLSPDSFNSHSQSFPAPSEVENEQTRGRADLDKLGYDDSASRSVRSRSRSPLSLPMVGTPLSIEGGMELPFPTDKAVLQAQPPSPRYATRQSSLSTQTPPISPSRMSTREQDMRLRDAAVLPRRRTLVEAPGNFNPNPAAKSNKVSPVDGFGPSGPPPPLPTSLSTGALSSFSVIKGKRVGDANLDNVVDLTQQSPTRSTFDRSALAPSPDVARSPTKRSLPHPPVAPKRSSSQLVGPSQDQAPPPRAGSYPLSDVTRGDDRERFASAPGAIPAQYRTDSPTRPLRLNVNGQQVPSRQSSQQFRTPPLFYPSSASLMPGLTDSGPYPAGPSRAAQAQQARPQVAEEVCLECMMRDRDMADVDVMGDGVWERSSDGEWRELLALENDVLDQFRRDEQAGQRGAEDDRVKQVVGWRGFSWEDGALPKGFLGARGGELTEERLKAQMAMNISASAHRYQTLQKYLFDQQQLIIELQAHRRQHGYAPAFPQTPVQGNSPAAQYAQFHNQPSRDSYPSYGTTYSGQAAPRPQTHFIPSQIQAPATPRQTQPAALQLRHGKGISSPGLLERSPRLDRDGAWDTSEARPNEWPPSPERNVPLRPFSFAVRANGGGAGSDDRHGKRNVLGRWGGSVTSFFGGSQNGSGSMMDMHLGLDADRRQRTSSNQVHNHPRSVSMATPTRPSFFTRNSSGRGSFSGSFATAFSSPPSPPGGERQPRHIENRGLPVAEPKKKKKGFKGFLQKLGGGSSKQSSPRGQTNHLAVPQNGGEEEQLSDLGAPLAPPPPLSYLVERGDRQHNRSGSSSAGLTQSAVAPQMRSVSAPMAKSPSDGSLSISPTSSRFATTNGRRESYASLGRRRSVLMDDSDSTRQRDSGVEMLDGKGQAPSRRSSAYGLMQEPEHGQWVETPSGRRVSIHQNGAASLSNSSGTMLASVETPGQHPSQVNRYKNLPPLPTGGASGSASPDSFLACFPNGGYTVDPGLVPRGQTDRRTMSMASSEIMDEYGLPSRRGRPGQEQSPRMAQSMYTQSGNGSYASFGGEMEGGGKRGKAKGRFGLAGLLGGGKKNRSQRGSAELSDAVASSPRSQTSFYR